MKGRFKDLAEVFSGEATLEQISREVARHMTGHIEPRRLIVDIQRRKDIYYARIYMLAKDFDKKE